LIVFALGFLLVGVPMAALFVVLRERRRKENRDE
jgi:hypothetical protein